MTTRLDKAVSRRTDVRDAGREIIVTLYPGGVIGFRTVRSREEFFASVDECYALAVRKSLHR